MSLDLEFAEFAVSGAAVLLAAGRQVWCAGRARPRPAESADRREVSGRRLRGANRSMAAALLLTLVLGGAATIDWADDSIRGTQTATHPPLLWPLVLLAAGALVSVAVNLLANPARSAARTGQLRRLRQVPQVRQVQVRQVPQDRHTAA